MRKEFISFKDKISKLKIGSTVKYNPIQVGNHTIDSDSFTLVAGPCAVESYEQLKITAEKVKQRGAHILRAGAYKPRTSPYAFQGLGMKGLSILHQVKNELQIPIITELLDSRDLPFVAEVADIIQIGSRNMQNFSLLKSLGHIHQPILLKRGVSATLEEFLLAAEYILDAGNEKVILCERGIRSYDSVTRNLLDLSAVAILKQVTHLPVFVDPSHATGIPEIIAPMSIAAKSAGANGIMIEIHPSPEEALSDGDQALNFESFDDLISSLGLCA
ncbi:3-deoxy-7-phosphoheptulonate synthase [Candidatus Berkiella cookevillensis]|uniref:3-deoxy-7-phosphoheptulonate synthase n=1 Tax=Candidatus Berkiella cookevillensis TaxID=437022 RepID=A0A0Q9YQW8_9GAMM|nr:3-deoxy-7-phosphoheptulonate synthase [Candidatus Berkiella cookevillensis]MCS5708180.1 3-deoxy-7-phosphoheptulonate synthase [Candidatus Berkiella cookevillensis]